MSQNGKKIVKIVAQVDGTFKEDYLRAWKLAGFDNEANCTRYLVRNFIKENKPKNE